VFDRFRALSTFQQIALVAVGIASICVLLGSIWYFALRVPYGVLFSGLRPSDAAAIVSDLDRKKIPYRLADGGATILVPADIADRTRLNVTTDDVPLKGTTGFELFDKSDMGLTDFAQKINYQRALQGELERTIQTLDGVDSARVHLSLGEDRIFRDDQVPPKASVMVRMQKGSTLSISTAQGIQHLVAAAVPNLDAANVVILDEKGRIVESPAPLKNTAVEFPAPIFETKPANRAQAVTASKTEFGYDTPGPEGEAAPLAAMVFLFLVLVGSIGGIGYLLLRPKRLSEAGRVKMAAQFRELLDRRQHDAVS
jgi:flagellar basal-body M-ring protein/flagellar hook-basal body protein fliF